MVRKTMILAILLAEILPSAVLPKPQLSNSSGSCVLLVKPSDRGAIERVYRQSETLYQERLKAASQQGGTGQSRAFRPILTGLAGIDILANRGATILPFHSEESIARFEPEFKDFLKSTTEHIKIVFNSSLKVKRNVDGKETWGCDPSLLRQNAIFLNSPEIDHFEEEPVFELTGSQVIEISPPADRPAPNDTDFVKQWDRSCTGQTIILSTPTGDKSFTCKPGLSDIHYLTGTPRPGKYQVMGFLRDTGIWTKHPDFDQKRIWYDLAYNAMDGSSNIVDGIGHGTHTGGTVLQTSNNGAFGAGSISQDIPIIPIQIFDKNGASDYAAIVRGVAWAPNALLKLRKEGKNYFGASNDSWTSAGFGSPDSLPELKKAVLAQLEAGIPMINAAANSNFNNDLNYYFLPQGWAKDFYRRTRAPLITVGATDYNGDRASFSNYGQLSTAVAAPGDPTYSTLPPIEGPDGASFGSAKLAGFFRGTSMSAPIVWLATLELERTEGEMALANLSDRLSGSSQKNPSLYGFFGGGLLNLYELVWVADNRPPGVPSGFKIEKVTDNSIVFSFDRPADINNAGEPRQIGSYNVWVSYNKIDERNYSQGTRLILWPNPTSNREIATLVGLKSGEPTYIVVEAIDQGGNSSLAPAVFAETNPLHTLWSEDSLSGGFTKESGWEYMNTGDYAKCPDCPVLWHKYQPTSEENRVSADMVYRVDGQNNLDTNKYGYKANEGRALSPWIGPLLKNVSLSMVSSRNTGLWYVRQKADGTKHWEFDGDLLNLTIYRKNKPPVKIAELPASRLGETPTPGAWINEKFSLDQFEGEEIRIAFDFNFSQRSYDLGYQNLGGIKIAKLEIVGTRTDFENLPAVPNGGFELAEPTSDAGEGIHLPRSRGSHGLFDLRRAKNWTFDEHICSDCKTPDDWYVSQIKDNTAPEGSAILRLRNQIGEEKSWAITNSDRFAAKPDLYELDQSVRLDGSGVAIVIGYTQDGQEIWLATQELSDTKGSWGKYNISFKLTDNIKTLKIRYGLRGRQESSTLDLDDVKVNFLRHRD